MHRTSRIHPPGSSRPRPALKHFAVSPERPRRPTPRADSVRRPPRRRPRTSPSRATTRAFAPSREPVARPPNRVPAFLASVPAASSSSPAAASAARTASARRRRDDDDTREVGHHRVRAPPANECGAVSHDRISSLFHFSTFRVSAPNPFSFHTAPTSPLSPSTNDSFFQIGTRAFNNSIASLAASHASRR